MTTHCPYCRCEQSEWVIAVANQLAEEPQKQITLLHRELLDTLNEKIGFGDACNQLQSELSAAKEEIARLQAELHQLKVKDAIDVILVKDAELLECLAKDDSRTITKTTTLTGYVLDTTNGDQCFWDKINGRGQDGWEETIDFLPDGARKTVAAGDWSITISFTPTPPAKKTGDHND